MTAALLAFDRLDEPLKPALDPRVYVEPADGSDAQEVTRQAAALSYLRQYAKRLIVFAVPNATRSEASKLRQYREGALYGAADLVCVWTGGVAFIEMKAGRTMPRANQIDFLNELAKRDHHVAVCRSRDGVARWLHAIGAPVPEVRA